MLNKIILWFYNFMTGGVIAKNTKEITLVNLEYDSEKINLYQKERLTLLLSDVSKHTPFYKVYNDTITFETLPVVNKNLINENYDAFMSNKYHGKKLKKVSTSGSTGVPFKIYQNPEKVKRQIADTLFYNELCGYKFGQKLIYLRIWNEINRLGFIQKAIKNVVPVDTTILSLENTKKIVHDISTSKNTYSILSYASSLELLERNLEELNISSVKGKMSCIITMAEALPIKTKMNIERIFGCSVYSRYSNSEIGFIAHQSPGFGENYLMNNASFLIEFLELDNDKPVLDGKPGRIVVTDLFNDAFPLIRYDTGDIGVKDTLNGKTVIDHIEGRKLDFITSANGDMVSPHGVDYFLRTLEGAEQFQLIQIGAMHYILKLNAKANADLNSMKMSAIKRLHSFLGETAVIDIEFVNEIPLLASGKRSIVLNHWKKQT